jgi:hypothetical protein
VATLGLHLAAIYVPFAQRLLKTTALPAQDLGMAAGAALVVLTVVELWKWGLRRRAAAVPR